MSVKAELNLRATLKRGKRVSVVKNNGILLGYEQSNVRTFMSSGGGQARGLKSKAGDVTSQRI